MKDSENTSTSAQGIVTSGANRSFWFFTGTQPIGYEKLEKDIETEILVIGGGISGLTTAYCLAKEGRKVVLIEDGFIGSGETGRTTAHLTCALDDRYFGLEKRFDAETAQLAANSHMAAIDWIANMVDEHNIDCHFKRVDGYLFLHPSDKKENLEEEYAATLRVGLNTELLDHVPYMSSEKMQIAIKFPNQGQFHILMYLQGLADAFLQAGGKIYTQTKAEDITSKGAKGNGYDIKANHIVVATNTPVNDWVTMHTKQWPYRTYVIGAKIPKGKLPYVLWWDTGDHDSQWICQPYHYVRLEEYDDQHDVLIVGGEDHRTGQTDDENLTEENRYDKLIEWTKKRFPAIEEVTFKWSGQVMEPLDSLAFIGKNPGNDNIYIITGDSGNGMTHGTIGGLLLKDLIMGKENPWAKIYDPSRITLNTAGDFLSEVGNMVAQYADWFSSEDLKRASDLKQGEGGVLVSGMRKVTIFRDHNDKLHSCSAVCPHLGGILQWNADEKTFDCPLHGSRFTYDGTVINGPASSNLKKIDDIKNE